MWLVNMNGYASEVIEIDEHEASTADEAMELAYERAEGRLCHQCDDHLNLGDMDIVTVDHNGEVVRDDFETEDQRQARAGALAELRALRELFTGLCRSDAEILDGRIAELEAAAKPPVIA